MEHFRCSVLPTHWLLPPPPRCEPTAHHEAAGTTATQRADGAEARQCEHRELGSSCVRNLLLGEEGSQVQALQFFPPGTNM